jgi:uncharacterized membrane protein
MLARYFKHDTLLLRLIAVMVFSSALASVLLFYRFGRTSSFSYLFLGWNLFLAWIPFILSLFLRSEVKARSWLKAGAFVLWLLFLPNAPYILTDLIHLRVRPHIPLWYDLLLILAFAWSGLMLGMASLLNVHIFLCEKLDSKKAWLVIIPVLLLCGFGIYLGRFVRFNSWDAFTDPVPVFRTSINLVLHPFSDMHATGFTMIISGFLLVSYLTLLALARPAKGNKLF